MPKVIENLREKILEEAKKEIAEIGYEGMTIRGIAKELGIGVGTLYNHFENKEAVVGAYMVEEWHKTYAVIDENVRNVKHPLDKCEVMYKEIEIFVRDHRKLFYDKEAKKTFASSYLTRHGMLVRLLHGYLEKSCEEYAINYTPYIPDFLIENILNMVTAGIPYSTFYDIMKPLFRDS
ncbi:MAG: TetR/AcrR family transcriptional regulator [Lachnospiraceae bacterium]|nr:TetR/AcrR family transcriptional regulator [Lachnospiraceae bacterium]